MVALKIWYADGQTDTVTAPQYGQAFDRALELGAIRAVDCHGIVYRKIDGEWISL